MSRLLSYLALAASTGACATILDFQEPTDLVLPAQIQHAEPMADAAPSASSSTATSDAPSTGADSALAASVVHDDGAARDAAAETSAARSCTCATASIAAWEGPFVVATTDGAEPPECGGAFAKQDFLGRSGAVAAPAECTCSCDPPTGVSCSVATTSFYETRTCTGSPSSQPGGDAPCEATAQSVTCADVPETCGAVRGKPKSLFVTGSTATGGACAPRAGVVLPAATYASAIRLCSSTSAASTSPACDGGACELAPRDGFSATNRCVRRSGEHLCPAAYPMFHLYYSGASDRRACSTCTCGEASGSACEITVSTYAGAGASPCAGTPASAGAALGCVDLSGASRFSVESPAPRGGSCLPSSVTATGAFVPEGPTTVCCLE